MAVVSDDGAKQVLSQLARYGYLLSDSARSGDDEDDSFEAYQRWTQRRQHREEIAASDATSQSCGWQLIPFVDDNDCYFTPKGLVRHLVSLIQQNEGRASLTDLCNQAHVDCQLFAASKLEDEAAFLWNELVEETESSCVTILGSNKSGAIQSVELVSMVYWERTLENVVAMVEEQGTVSVSDIMTTHSLSRDAILHHLLVVGGNNGSIMDGRIRVMNDSKELVSESQCRSLRQQVLKHFASLEEPVQIDDVCQEQGWDWNQVLEWLTIQLEDQNEKEDESETSSVVLAGEIHTDDITCGQTAMYLPVSYRTRQQQGILDFLSSNGYITMERAGRNYHHGYLPAQITTLIQEAFPGAVVLDNGQVFVTDFILQQVQVGVQIYFSSAAASEFLDLQDYLPAKLLQSSTIILGILESIGFTSPRDGVAVIGNDRAIVAGKEVIRQSRDKHLSQLIQKHAKNRAAEIFQLQFELDEEDDENDDADGVGSGRKASKSAKSKRKGKNSKQNKKNKDSKEDISNYLVPLSDIVSAIIDAYPVFQEDAMSPEDTKAENMKWEDDDDQLSDSILAAQFCRKAFYSEKLVEQCQRAVSAELQRLESEKNSKAKMSRKDAAAKVRSVEAAFQDAFITLCYLIQAQAKSIAFFANLEDCFDEGSMEISKNEFLQGPCADLTSRITQHCLFQEEAHDDGMFTFVHPTQQDKNERNSSGLPRHCADVATTSRHYPESYLSSLPPREPLPVLRESFSGNTGIVLSKMWILCGGECYRGGVRTISNDEEGVDSVHVRPGNVDTFLSFAAENCLTLCGLPYKKLDKKAEKSLLFARKQQLNSLLASTDAAADPICVLEYTVMILFQQVRSLIVSGSMLRGPIIEALSRERKIPDSVAKALILLNEMIEDDSKAVNGELVSLVKECGLVRDISKHDTTSLETFLADC